MAAISLLAVINLFFFGGGGVNFLFCVCFDRVTMEEVQRQSVNLPLRALFHRPGSN